MYAAGPQCHEPLDDKHARAVSERCRLAAMLTPAPRASWSGLLRKLREPLPALTAHFPRMGRIRTIIESHRRRPTTTSALKEQSLTVAAVCGPGDCAPLASEHRLTFRQAGSKMPACLRFRDAPARILRTSRRTHFQTGIASSPSCVRARVRSSTARFASWMMLLCYSKRRSRRDRASATQRR